MSLFNYHSARAHKARLASHLAHPEVYWTCALAGVLLAVGGVLIAWTLHPLGWLVAGLAGPLWMLAGFSRSLRDLPPLSHMQHIDDVLDAEVLGHLPAEHTPEQLAQIAGRLSGGQFFAGRLGLDTQFVQSIWSGQPATSSAAVWEEAERLRTAAGAPSITAATVTAALIRSAPQIEAILASLRLTKDDITAGLAWHDQLHATIALHNARRHDGGLGRDWAFGYTPLLDRFGLNISLHMGDNLVWQQGIASRQTATQQLVRLLAQPGRRNAALVGGLGSGKTTLVHALARRLMNGDPALPTNLHYQQIIALDPSRLIAQARGRGELEELVDRLCYEAYHAKNVILFLDDAQLFFEDGNGAVNLSNILLPVLENGALPLILAMDEQRWLRIAQANPGLAQHFNRVPVPPMSEAETMIVLQDQFVVHEYNQKVIYTYGALRAAYQLSSRISAEQVMPGRALKLLEAGAGAAEDGFVTRRSIEQAIEQTQGIKVGTADTSAERQTLLNLEDLIHKRMINQTRAVQVVSDALRRARAGVRNASRPIGTFLFLGPTGVGKTELAKSVAAVFFDGEEHLVRLDLNEFVRPEDVSRLIADGAEDPRSLTAQIAKKPFSVVLLDEIEKAHPNVLNTLLQLLDEGILRDVNNREVSFRDAVIIATSNAGAERIRAHIDAGEQLEQFEEAFVNELINANVFRPEFLNRFDEIVLFRPLKLDELLQVVEIILASINKNLAAQQVSVAVDDAAKQLLVQHGNDPRLGARPLRRVVQRVVENIVSNQLLTGEVVPGGKVQVTAEDVHRMLGRGHES